MEDTHPYTLGIWDGHDAGAALIRGSEILFAINEERLTRRKLEVGFPVNSIKACLEGAGITPKEVGVVGCSTADVAKTLTRLVPAMKERHYLIRRRKLKPPLLHSQKLFKFWLTTRGAGPLSKALSTMNLKNELKALDFDRYEFQLLDHHAAHAACAGLLGPFDDALVVTLDGVGDGLSGSINVLEKGKLKRISSLPASHSLGVFFEQVTYLMNMRELEDEGKVMALADYSFEIPWKDNQMKDFFTVEGLQVKARYSPLAMLKKIGNILWKNTWEMSARMAQDVLENCIIQLFQNAVEKTGKHNVAWCGGIASNVKLNQKLRNLKEIENWFVYPHMGDGGLALGAAALASYNRDGIASFAFKNAYLGQGFSDERIKAAIEKSGCNYTFIENIEEKVAELVAKEQIIFWFQGRSEYGPRALGNRSIVAPAHSLKCKDELNLYLKRRNWFQPFCPSMIKEDAPVIIADYDGKPSNYMTMAYTAKPELLEKVAAVIGKDGSMRPQIVEDENTRYRRLIEGVKKHTGLGIMLNTSFNRHGEPLVNTPEDAIKTFKETGCHYMALEKYLLEQ